MILHTHMRYVIVYLYVFLQHAFSTLNAMFLILYLFIRYHVKKTAIHFNAPDVCTVYNPSVNSKERSIVIIMRINILNFM